MIFVFHSVDVYLDMCLFLLYVLNTKPVISIKELIIIKLTFL